eukprot:g4059.t1
MQSPSFPLPTLPPAPSLVESEIEGYRKSLKRLGNYPAKDIINHLTYLARDACKKAATSLPSGTPARGHNHNRDSDPITLTARHVALELLRHLQNSGRDCKVPILFLIDSIVFNSRSSIRRKDGDFNVDFQPIMAERIVEMFKHGFKWVLHDQDRIRLYRMLKTWDKQRVYERTMIKEMYDYIMPWVDHQARKQTTQQNKTDPTSNNALSGVSTTGDAKRGSLLLKLIANLRIVLRSLFKDLDSLSANQSSVELEKMAQTQPEIFQDLKFYFRQRLLDYFTAYKEDLVNVKDSERSNVEQKLLALDEIDARDCMDLIHIMDIVIKQEVAREKLLLEETGTKVASSKSTIVDNDKEEGSSNENWEIEKEKLNTLLKRHREEQRLPERLQALEAKALCIGTSNGGEDDNTNMENNLNDEKNSNHMEEQERNDDEGKQRQENERDLLIRFAPNEISRAICGWNSLASTNSSIDITHLLSLQNTKNSTHPFKFSQIIDRLLDADHTIQDTNSGLRFSTDKGGLYGRYKRGLDGVESYEKFKLFIQEKYKIGQREMYNGNVSRNWGVDTKAWQRGESTKLADFSVKDLFAQDQDVNRNIEDSDYSDTESTTWETTNFVNKQNEGGKTANRLFRSTSNTSERSDARGRDRYDSLSKWDGKQKCLADERFPRCGICKELFEEVYDEEEEGWVYKDAIKIGDVDSLATDDFDDLGDEDNTEVGVRLRDMRAYIRAINALRRRKMVFQGTFTPENESKYNMSRNKSTTDRNGVYLGIDPTASSLHLGNLVSLNALRVLSQECELPTYVVLGSFTAGIGDPSGRSNERPLLAQDEIEKNRENISNIVRQVLPECNILDNTQWLGGLTVFDMLRNAGRHFRISTMLNKEATKSRLADGSDGLSYAEFSYQIFQALDFLHLFNKNNVAIQIGGSDQWGNITAGCELIRRINVEQDTKDSTDGSFGITTPLLTNSSGMKIGKSLGGGGVWLDPKLTSAYDMYQFLVNIPDTDVCNMLRLLTLMPVNEIDLIENSQCTNTYRKAKLALAQNVIETCHTNGPTSFTDAHEASQLLFGSAVDSENQDHKNEFSDGTFKILSEQLPTYEIPNRQNSRNERDQVTAILADHGIVKSRSEAKRLLKNGAIRVNRQKLESDEDRQIAEHEWLNQKYCIIQVGKKKFYLLQR